MKKINIILISSIILVILSLGIVLIIRKMNIKQKLVSTAKAELKKWKGIKETSINASPMLLEYWKSVGRNFTASQMQSASFQSGWPWSSAFISWLFYKSGAGDKFPYSAAHSTYFQSAKKGRDYQSAPLRGFRITEYAPKVGDLVVYTRKHGKGYDSNGHFPSHGELVIEVGNGYIKTVGGNVSNSVTLSTFKINELGFLSGNRKSFFMVIQNNI